MRNITNADQQKFPGPRPAWELANSTTGFPSARWTHHCDVRGTVYVTEEQITAWGCFGCGGMPPTMRRSVAKAPPPKRAYPWAVDLTPEHQEELAMELHEAVEEGALKDALKEILLHWREVAKADLAATMQEGPL